MVFLAHYVGGGIDAILDLMDDDYFAYLSEAIKLYEQELKTPRRSVVAGFEK